MDIAELGFKVDTSGIEDADKALVKLGKTSGDTEATATRSGGAIDRAHRNASGGIMAAHGSANLLTTALKGMGIVAAAAGFGSLVSDTLAFGKSLGEVSTLVDTSVVSMKDLKTESFELSRTYGAVPIEQTRAFYQAISAGAMDGVDGTTSLANAVETMDAANRLAIGGATDLNTAITGTMAAFNAYGDESESVADISDALFVAMKAGITTVGELAGSLSVVAPSAAQAGISLDEVLAATAAITKTGKPTAEAMNGIRAAIQAISGPSEQAKKLALELGLNFSEAGLKADGLAGFLEKVKVATGGSTEQLYQLLGSSEAVNAVLVLIGNGAKNFADNLEAMKNKAGATDEAFNKMATGAGFQLTIIIGNLRIAFMQVSTALISFFLPALTLVANNIGPLFAAVESGITLVTTSFGSLIAVVANSTVFQALAGMFDSIAASVSPLVPYIVEFGGAMAAVIAVFAGSTAAWAVGAAGIASIGAALVVVGKVIAANLIVVGIAAIAAAVYLIYDNWDGVVAWWSGLWADMSATLERFDLSGIVTAMESMVAYVQLKWNELKSIFTDGAFLTALAVMWDGVAVKAQAAWTYIVTSARAVLPEIKAVFLYMFGDLSGIFNEVVLLAKALWTDLKALFAGEGTTLSTLWTQLVQGWSSIVGAGWDLIVATVTLGWALIKNAIKTGWDLATGFLASALLLLRGDFAGAWDMIVDTVKELGDNLGKAFSDLYPKLKNAGMALVQFLYAGVVTSLQLINTAMLSLGRMVLDYLTGLGQKMLDAGKSLLSKLTLGMVGGKAEVEQISNTIAEIPAEALKEAEPGMIESGWNATKGWALGLLKGKDEVVKASDVLALTPIERATTLLEMHSPSKVMMALGSFVGEGFAQGILASTDAINNATGAMVNGATAAFAKLRDELLLQAYALTHTAEETEKLKLSMEGMTDAEIEWAQAQKANNAIMEEKARIQERVHGVLKDLAIEQALLTIELEDGAEAAELIKHQIEGYDKADAALAVTMKAGNEVKRETLRLQEQTAKAIEALVIEQDLWNIELTQGKDAADAYALVLKGATQGQADHMVATKANLELQKEFRDVLKDAFLNADSIKDGFKSVGQFMENWLKEKISTFAANKIMVYMGFGDGGAVGGLSRIFSEAGGPAKNFGNIISGLKTVFSGADAGAISASKSVGVLASNMNGAVDLMGGMGSAATSAGSAAGSASTSFGVLAADGNAAAASMGSTALTLAGTTLAFGALGYGLGEVTGAANSAAMGITTGLGAAIGSIVPVIGTYVGAAIGAAVGSAFGGTWEEVSKGFNVAFKDGELSGQATTYMEKERSMWRGTASKIIYSELDDAISGPIQQFFNKLGSDTVALATRLGLSGASSIMQSYEVAETKFKGSAEKIGEQMAQYYEDASRQAYQTLLNRLGPELQKAIEQSVDMAEGSIESIALMFEEVAIVSQQLVPMLDAFGISLGKTADEANAAGLVLSESMGGASVAVQELGGFLAKIAPEGMVASIALDRATQDLAKWNATLGLGTTYAEAATGRFTGLAASIDTSTQAGSNLSTAVTLFSGGVDSATGILGLNTAAFGRWLETQARGTEAQEASYQMGLKILDAHLRMADSNVKTATSVQEYATSIDALGNSNSIATQQLETFTTVVDSTTGALSLNTAGLDLYMSSLDRTTVAGEAAWQSANALAEAFDYNAGSAITTSAEMYTYAQSLDWTTEAGRAAGEAAMAVADSLLAVEQEGARQILTMNTVADTFRQLGLTLDPVNPSAMGASDALVELMGGLDAFTTATGNYFDKFYSDTEKTNIQLASSANAVALFNDAISDADLALAGITDGTIDSAAEFRQFADAQDVYSEAGRRNLQMVWDVTDAMYILTESGMSMEEAIASLPPELQAAYSLMVTDTQALTTSLPEGMAPALNAIVENAATAGADMQAALLQSFDKMLADAGLTASELPADLQNAYVTMVNNAGAAASELPTDLQAAYDTMTQDAGATASELTASSATGSDAVSELAASAQLMASDTTGAAQDVVKASTMGSNSLGDLGGSAEDMGGSASDSAAETRAAAAEVFKQMAYAAYNTIQYTKQMSEFIVRMGRTIGGQATEINTAARSAGGGLSNLSGSIGSMARAASSAASSIASAVRSIQSSASAARSVDGSHHDGLSYVPFDNYRALLHEGERVLTAREAQQYNSLGNRSTPAPRANTASTDTLAELLAIRNELIAIRAENSSASATASLERNKIGRSAENQTEVLHEVKRGNDRMSKKVTLALSS